MILLFHNHGVDQSDKNSVRNNKEVFDLVWGYNPYIKSITSQTPTAGQIMQNLWPSPQNNYWFINRIEIAHKLNPSPNRKKQKKLKTI